MPYKVLVADDSLYARLVVMDVVKRLLDQVVFSQASSGAEAIQLIAESDQAFDYFLIDINMASPDGMAVSQLLTSSGIPAERIALVTGNNSGDLMKQASQMGVSYIHKAVSPDDMEQFEQRLERFFKERY
jgi:CheY-like chemotaxis protein